METITRRTSMRIDLDTYMDLKAERDILLTWYIQTLEHYDGLTTPKELEREVLLELKAAVDKEKLK
jgi:hypothetical protein